MTLEQLRIFAAVAERKHVTQAARALNLAQSAASHAIRGIERTMHGTVASSISFAAMTRPWPAMITPSESIRMGSKKPYFAMLATICVTCAGEWVRAFLA